MPDRKISHDRQRSGASRSPFPGNRIPLNRADPVFTKFLSFDPYQPENNRNDQAFINRTGPHNNINADTPYHSYRTATAYRLDHSFSDRQKIFGRYTNYRSRQWSGSQANVQNHAFDYNYSPFPTDQHQFVISDTITINPTMVNELRLGANRRKYTLTPGSLNQDWAGKLGIPNVSPATMPTFLSATGDTLYFTFPGGRSADVNENGSLQENLTMIHGRHTLKTGYELLHGCNGSRTLAWN